MNKKLKFAAPLVPLVLNGSKNSTWRLWDDKDLQTGDTVDFTEHTTQKVFASGTLTKVIEKPLGAITEEDKSGHETFGTDAEMYTTYTNYYGKPVGKDTLVKIIWFKLVK